MRNSKDRRAEKKLLKDLEQLTSKRGELKGKIISAYEGLKRCAKAGYETSSVHLVSLDYAKWMPHHICKDLALKVLKCKYIFHPNSPNMSPKGFHLRRHLAEVAGEEADPRDQDQVPAHQAQAHAHQDEEQE